MTKSKNIAFFLGYTEEEYWDEYISLYMRWCMQFSLKTDKGDADAEDLQKLMANTAINKYYTERHQDLEQQALDILKHQDAKITIEAAKRIYRSVMCDLFQYYPKPLFEAARKLSVIGNPN